MDDLPLVERIVRTCAEGLDVPVTCKIRMFPDLQKTIAYAQMLERAGASLIAVHGRLREQKKSNGADANWDVIKVVLLCSWSRTLPEAAVLICLSSSEPADSHGSSRYISCSLEELRRSGSFAGSEGSSQRASAGEWQH